MKPRSLGLRGRRASRATYRRRSIFGWQLPDPKGGPPDEVRALRDDIERQVAEIATGLGRDAV
jgi:hypothetical protein